MKLQTKVLSAIIPIFTFSLLVISCQREIDIEPGESPTGVPDSIVLKKFISLDTTRLAPFDTVSYFSFIYDADGRIKTEYIIRPFDPDGDTASTITYFYNGNDTLPYKREMLSAASGPGLGDSYMSFWEYDNMGRVIKDSSVIARRDNPPNEEWTVQSAYFSYTPVGVNTLIRLKFYDVFPGPVSYESAVILKTRNTIINNCVVNQHDSVFYLGTVINGAPVTDTTYSEVITDYVYDTKPNPFYKTYPVHLPVSISYFFGDFDEWNQVHNTTEYNYRELVYYTNTGAGNTTGNSPTKHYWYRSDGYPLIQRQSIPIGGGQFIHTKDVFIYGR